MCKASEQVWDMFVAMKTPRRQVWRVLQRCGKVEKVCVSL